jgi:hypothetical protein
MRAGSDYFPTVERYDVVPTTSLDVPNGLAAVPTYWSPKLDLIHGYPHFNLHEGEADLQVAAPSFDRLFLWPLDGLRILGT